MGVGAGVCAIPHFFVGTYDFDRRYEAATNHHCQSDLLPSADPPDCDNQNRNLNRYQFVFMAGTFLVEMGGAPFFIVAIAYVDENVSQRTSILYTGKYLNFYASLLVIIQLYLGILSACFLIGIIFGYLTAGGLLRFPSDLDKGIRP